MACVERPCPQGAWRVVFLAVTERLTESLDGDEYHAERNWQQRHANRWLLGAAAAALADLLG
jgi:hypothetical protein